MVKFSSRKQRFRSRPAQSCTPMMPKMKKTKKQRRSTFPSMGSVSSNRFTRIRMPGRGRAEEVASEKQKGQVKKPRGGWEMEAPAVSLLGSTRGPLSSLCPQSQENGSGPCCTFRRSWVKEQTSLEPPSFF